MASPYLEIVKSHWDEVLDNRLWVALLEQCRVGPYRPQRALPTSTPPCVYHSVPAQPHIALPRSLPHRQRLALLCPPSTNAVGPGEHCPPACTRQTARACGAGLGVGRRRGGRGGPPATGRWLQSSGTIISHTYSGVLARGHLSLHWPLILPLWAPPSSCWALNARGAVVPLHFPAGAARARWPWQRGKGCTRWGAAVGLCLFLKVSLCDQGTLC